MAQHLCILQFAPFFPTHVVLHGSCNKWECSVVAFAFCALLALLFCFKGHLAWAARFRGGISIRFFIFVWHLAVKADSGVGL